MNNLGEALAAYQMTLAAAASPFDRWHFGGEEQAVDEQVKRGFALFTGKAGCSQCHLVNAEFALFTDQQLHNTGIGYRASLPEPKRKERVQLAPGVFVEVPEEIIAQVSEPPAADLGRYEITQDPADRWKYKTPGLRNVALTAPYMHDGSLRTLREVVAFYNRGGVPNPLQDTRLRPLGLDDHWWPMPWRRRWAMSAMTGPRPTPGDCSGHGSRRVPTGGSSGKIVVGRLVLQPQLLALGDGK